MAVKKKRYHIGADGIVAECKASLRSCPYEDFQTREGAETARQLKIQKTEVEAGRARLDKIFNDPNTVSSVGRFDMGSKRVGKRVRDYAHSLDNSYMSTGKDPDLYYATIDLQQENPMVEKVRVQAVRRVMPDYTDGKLKVVWGIKLEERGRYGKTQEMEFEFDDNPQQAMRGIKTYLEEAVRMNSTQEGHTIEEESDKLFTQFRNVYGIVEEEAQGPYVLWEKHGWNEGLGTFSESNSIEVVADVNYATSTLRPRSLERFMEDNTDYRVTMPEINLRIKDDEDGQSEAWWAASYNNNQWSLEFLQEGSDRVRKIDVDDPEEAQDFIQSFVQSNMRTQDDWTANEKSEYVANFMIEMDRIEQKTQRKVDEFTKIIEDSSGSRNPSKNRNRMEDKIFGNTDKNSTMGKILGIFG